MRVFSFFLLFCFLSLSAASPQLGKWRVSSAARTVDIRTQQETNNVLFDVTNTGSSQQDTFVFAIAKSKVVNLAYISANEVSDADVPPALQIEQLPSNDDALFQVKLPAVAVDKSFQFSVKYICTKTLAAMPSEVTQSQAQSAQFVDSALIYSLYDIDKQNTNVLLFSDKVTSFTQEKAEHKNDEIHYGPYSNQKAKSSSPLEIYYENNSPFAVITSMRKQVEVSHWGNIAIEERVDLVHAGAKLKGHFSRYDFQRSPSPSSFRTLQAVLPKDATDVYYRDRIGNISTSHLRQEEDFVNVDVQPRFPMFGGWKIDFKLGYNVPASSWLGVDASAWVGGAYVLSVPLSTSFVQAVVDEATIVVVLPEGATNVHWKAPFEVESVEFGSLATYLDVSGRPTLIIKAKNLVYAHQSNSLLVAYDFPKSSMLREPAMLVATFFLLFISFVFFHRFELRIVSASESRSRRGERGNANANSSAIVAKLDALNAAYSSKNNDKINAADSVAAELKAALTDVSKDAHIGEAARALLDLLTPYRTEAKKYAKNEAGAKAKFYEIQEQIDNIIQQL